MKAIKVDLNADLGERPEAYDVDAELMKFISSANIACGGHAGDKESVRRMVELASSFGVAVGAHPSFPDRQNFGRIAIKINHEDLQQSLERQVGLVVDVASRFGLKVRHVKPHGALYHSANSDAAIAQTIVNAIRTVDSSMVIVVQYGSVAAEYYQHTGMQFATEGFADRGYEANGSLRSRTLSDALLDESHAIEQALNIVLHQHVVALDGSRFAIDADTLCIHSDTPGAASIARRVRDALKAAGVRIASF